MKQINSLLNINANSDADSIIGKYDEQFNLISCYSEQFKKAKWTIVNEQAAKWHKELLKIWGNDVELQKNLDDDARTMYDK